MTCVGEWLCRRPLSTAVTTIAVWPFNMRRILLRMRSTLPIRRALVLAATAWLATAAVRAADDTASRWWAHIEALANDGMEGRNTGSAGHRRAAEYVAAQFQKAALEPAGAAGGYIQPVKFNTRRIDEAKS